MKKFKASNKFKPVGVARYFIKTRTRIKPPKSKKIKGLSLLKLMPSAVKHICSIIIKLTFRTQHPCNKLSVLHMSITSSLMGVYVCMLRGSPGLASFQQQCKFETQIMERLCLRKNKQGDKGGDPVMSSVLHSCAQTQSSYVLMHTPHTLVNRQTNR